MNYSSIVLILKQWKILNKFVKTAINEQIEENNAKIQQNILKISEQNWTDQISKYFSIILEHNNVLSMDVKLEKLKTYFNINNMKLTTNLQNTKANFKSLLEKLK